MLSFSQAPGKVVFSNERVNQEEVKCEKQEGDKGISIELEGRSEDHVISNTEYNQSSWSSSEASKNLTQS